MTSSTLKRIIGASGRVGFNRMHVFPINAPDNRQSAILKSLTLTVGLPALPLTLQWRSDWRSVFINRMDLRIKGQYDTLFPTSNTWLARLFGKDKEEDDSIPLCFPTLETNQAIVKPNGGGLSVDIYVVNIRDLLDENSLRRVHENPEWEETVLHPIELEDLFLTATFEQCSEEEGQEQNLPVPKIRYQGLQPFRMGELIELKNVQGGFCSLLFHFQAKLYRPVQSLHGRLLLFIDNNLEASFDAQTLLNNWKQYCGMRPPENNDWYLLPLPCLSNTQDYQVLPTTGEHPTTDCTKEFNVKFVFEGGEEEEEEEEDLSLCVYAWYYVPSDVLVVL